MRLTPDRPSWQSAAHCTARTEILMPTESKHPETIVLHAGYRSDPATNAVAVSGSTCIQVVDPSSTSVMWCST